MFIDRGGRESRKRHRSKRTSYLTKVRLKDNCYIYNLERKKILKWQIGTILFPEKWVLDRHMNHEVWLVNYEPFYFKRELSFVLLSKLTDDY